MFLQFEHGCDDFMYSQLFKTKWWNPIVNLWSKRAFSKDTGRLNLTVQLGSLFPEGRKATVYTFNPYSNSMKYCDILHLTEKEISEPREVK